MTFKVSVEESPLLAESFVAQVGDPAHGAQVHFFGAVRNHHLGKKVVAVSYDAFVPLAIKELEAIAAEVCQGTPQAKVLISHRIGRLQVGELSVAIGVSTPHRDESYKISRAIIEQIKVRVPIWKKEHYENGDSDWVQGHALCQH
jgi:molybdopterin synthase catalytic subunit